MHGGNRPGTRGTRRADSRPQGRLTVHLAVLVALAGGLAGTSGTARATGSSEADSALTQIERLRSEFEGSQEQVQTMQSDLDKLKRFKISGYLQARWQHAETSNDSVRVAGSPYTATPANLDQFFIRRGRFKLTYDANPYSQGVIYFDGGTDRAVRLLEGYVTLMDPWTPLKRHQLTMGQFNVPFGYEIERSSSVRELPERSRAENVLFSGERDRGIKLVDQWTDRLETVVAVLNGGGINQPDFPNADPTKGKDFTARARWSESFLDVAASWYNGRNLVPLTGPDVELNKTRLGADAQYYYELPTLGGGSLRAEFYTGHEVNPDSVKALVVAPTSAKPARTLKAGANARNLATDMRGGYLMWVQNVGDKVQLAARYDMYDPNTDRDHDQFTRLGLGVNYFYDGYTRITVAYDMPKTDAKGATAGTYVDPHDNLWTVQFQIKY